MVKRVDFLIFDAFGIGGTVRAVLESANSLAQAGFDVQIVSVFQSALDPKFSLDPSIQIRVLAPRRATKDSTRWNLNLRERVQIRKASKELHAQDPARKHFSRLSDAKIRDYLRESEARIVVSTRLSLNLLTARWHNRAIRPILQEHTYFGAHDSATQLEITRAYSQGCTVVTVTQEDCLNYQSALGDSAKVIAIGNALPEIEFIPSELRSKNVLSVARLSNEKGVDLLIDAAKLVVPEFPDWHFWVAGAGPEYTVLQKQIFDLGLHNNVHLIGQVNDIAGLYSQASIYVQPSRFEGFGIAIIEAMASRLPVIAFDCPVGPRSIIEDGVDGLLVPEQDIESLARKLRELMSNSKLREEIANSAVSGVSKFSKVHIDELLVELIRSELAELELV